MTIEELKAEWDSLKIEGWLNKEKITFCGKHMDKLLAVAEAAQPLSVKTSFNKDSWTQVDELNQKFKDLLGE